MAKYHYPEGDVRRDLADLRLLMESGAYISDGADTEYFKTHITAERAREIEARLPDGPIRVIKIKTASGWYQIEIGDDSLVVRVISAHKGLSIRPQAGNTIELTATYDR